MDVPVHHLQKKKKVAAELMQLLLPQLLYAFAEIPFSLLFWLLQYDSEVIMSNRDLLLDSDNRMHNAAHLLQLCCVLLKFDANHVFLRKKKKNLFVISKCRI